MISVRRIIFSVFCGIFMLLILVGMLGVMQFRLTDDYNRVIAQGGNILFQFNLVREQITRSMLEENWQALESSTRGIEALNSDLSTLLDSSLIPKEYKIALINQVDLPGIILLNRRLVGEADKEQWSFKLHDQLRLMSDQLIRFDRVLAAEMKTQLVRFQNLAIGVLTVIVAVISLLLLVLYQKGFAPLIKLSSQLHSQKKLQPLPPDPRACREIRELTQQLNRVILAGEQGQVVANGPGFSPDKINNFSNQLNGIINYTQLLIDEERQGAAAAEKVPILEKILSSGEIMTSILHEQQLKDER
ncbi:hypothetical protein [Desulfogranum mediterraneum]|uniref:hypothetical protein n=1 Tax=Desulfogranum mediterraneum TaxID=160661 RepID=UPI0003FEC599|nr:hypothetical protein [Desulfogranum mediterraneum]